jgi:hypothetical protein
VPNRHVVPLMGVAVFFSLSACRSVPAPVIPTPANPPSPVVVNEVAKALSRGVTLDANDPATCEACHGTLVAEWRESLHSRSHHSRDPLYDTMRTMRTAKQGPHIPAACATCHNPRDPVDHESAAAKGGVTCATCHELDGVHLGDGRKGTTALVPGPAKRFRGPHDIIDGTSPIHATGPALPAMADGATLCLACHGEERNAAGVSTCSTGIEHAAGKTKQGCTTCHMEELPGSSGAVSTRATHRSHRFRGPHQAPDMLAEAVSVTGQFDGDALVARLENRTGHGFPTGFPARMAVLEVRGFDAQGKDIFRNVTNEPLKEQPDAVFNMGYVDAEGKPALAPFAAKLVRDTRLKPDETREVRISLPPGVTAAELRVHFFLVAPPAAKAMGYQGPELAPHKGQPTRVAR